MIEARGLKKVKVANIREIGFNSMKCVDVNGRKVLIANIEGKFYGMMGICSHAGGHLWEGKLNGYIVKCPRHGSEFDVRTGKAIKGPWVPFGKVHDLPTYTTSVEDDDLFLDLPE
jgi:nitrite reductase/ring-hydroxylating ferredoxin subunit